MDYKYLTAREAGSYAVAGKVHYVVEISGDPRILIFDGLTPFRVSIVCRSVPGKIDLIS